MSALPYVFDGSSDNFRQLVLENSHKGVVLVNYWLPNAGPCLKLWQVLAALSQEYGGRFLLVNINTAKQQSLVREHAVNSVPTIKVYQRGAVVESVYGAQSAAALRAVIDKYVAPAQNAAVVQALRAYQAGQVAPALSALDQAARQEPANGPLQATYIKLLLREQGYDDIERHFTQLPPEVQARPDIGALRVHAQLLHLAQAAPPVAQLDERLAQAPEDSAAALTRAAVALVQDDYEAALTGLLEIQRRDPRYKDELARRAMLVIFKLLGDQHPLTRRFRNALRGVLH